MKIRIRKKSLLYGVCAVASAVAYGPSRANAQANLKLVPGEVLVYCQPGTTQADVNALAAIVSATKITPNLMTGVYDFTLPAGQATQQGTLTAISQLKGDPRLKWVGGNRIYSVYQTALTPNDPMYSQMHPLPQINMPQAWALQKGAVGVNLADIDSGFDYKHEDLLNRYDLTDSYNWGDGNANIEAGIEDHGVSTSGIMIANTNNGIGVSGICWQNVLCIGEKVQSETGTAGALTLAALLSAYADIHAKFTKAHIVAVNMSYGGPGDPTNPADPEVAALQILKTDGLILVAAAGNSSADNHSDSPAGISFVTTVSAVNRNGALTYYSSFGKVDIAAPGGEQYSDTDPNGYLVCKLGSGYAFEQGTSFACPTVTAVATLLMSVPGVTATRALSVLLSTANKSGLSAIPDPKFGNGIVDAYAALAQVSSTTSIISPPGIETSTGQSSTGYTLSPVETQKPLMAFKAYNISTDNETFTVDPGPGQIAFTATQLIQNVVATGTAGTSYSATSTIANVSDVTLVGTTTGTNPQYTISFRYTFPIGSSGTHIIQVTGLNTANNTTVTDQRSFILSPYTFPVDTSGVALVSFPYYESPEDVASATAARRGALIPSGVNLFRWFNVATLKAGTSTQVLTGEYAIYGSGHTSADPGATDPNSALTPTLYVPTLDPASAGTVSPLGTAYFMTTPAPIPYNSYGTDYGTSSFRIPLHQGWNMVGDPYNFAVGFNGLEIEELSGTRVTIQAAVDANILLPHVYHYSNGDYTFDSLPDGSLLPWQGQWLYVLPANGGTTLSDGVAAYLIVLPAAIPGSSKAATTLNPIQAAVSSPSAIAGPGSWSLKLQAQANSMHDNNNSIGMSSRATMGMDFTKVPKPPKAGNYVNIGITHSGIAIDTLAQDILPLGATRTWAVSVSTNQSRSAVSVAWPSMATVPKNYRLVLTDTVTGQTVDMRNESSYQFTSGAGVSSRAFSITATPANNRNRAMVTNITVNPGRTNGRAAGTTEIGYLVSTDSRVDISVLGLNGKVISIVSPSRAVTAGTNAVVWTGQDLNGHVVPGGSYVLQVRAIGADGELTRQIVPLTVTGR